MSAPFSLYTPLEDAVIELRARRAASTPGARNPLERHLSSQLYGVIFRHVATPNFELERFVSLASSAGLVPLILEFSTDRFITRNPSKCALVRMRFSDGPNSPGNVSGVLIAEMPLLEGTPIRQLRTRWGQPLASFHHELCFLCPVFRTVEIFDASDWSLALGASAAHRYEHILSLFVHHGILFEDFLLTPEERQFTTGIVVPAFEQASARHNHRPLICRIDPTDAAEREEWFHYPAKLKALVLARSQAKKLSVGPCEVGLGVFAKCFIRRGQPILRLSGRTLTFDEAHANEGTSFNMLQVAPRLYLDLDPPGVFFNHSCDPNAGIRNDLILNATRNIAAGEEIRYDYSTTMNDQTATMDCTCGNERCRKRVGDFDTLPVELQRHYLKHGIVQSFICHAFCPRSQAESFGTHL